MNDLLNNNSMIKEIKELLLTARQNVAVQVNSELLTTYWQIGRIIVVILSILVYTFFSRMFDLCCLQ